MGVRDPDTFVIKLLTINTHTTSAIPICDISSLYHYHTYKPVEPIPLVMILFALLASAQRSEVFRRLWHILIKQFEDDSTLLIAFLTFLTNTDIEVSLNIIRVELR